MAKNFTQARASNRQAADALAERDRLKRNAATKNPQADTFAETAARVKRAGTGSWTSNPDAIYSRNSGKQRT